MGDLLALLHGPMSGLAVAGLAALWVVKAGLGWLAFRWWRTRRG
ncbi:hypothetical protein [Salipiger sp.]